MALLKGDLIERDPFYPRVPLILTPDHKLHLWGLECLRLPNGFGVVASRSTPMGTAIASRVSMIEMSVPGPFTVTRVTCEGLGRRLEGTGVCMGLGARDSGSGFRVQGSLLTSSLRELEIGFRWRVSPDLSLSCIARASDDMHGD